MNTPVKSVTTHEAKTHLSRLLAEVEAGEVIVIRRGDREVAKLVRVGAERRPTRPKIGTATARDVEFDDEAFRPASDEELRDWGL